MNFTETFLYAEVSYQELYDDIMDFILSPNVLSGEFEGNEFIIMKMDQENYIVYPEYIHQNSRIIPGAMAFYRKQFISLINDYAVTCGVKLKHACNN